MRVEIILLQLFIFMVLVVSARDWRPKHGLDTRRKEVTQHPYFSSVQFYFFEGVDYDFTNDDILKEHKDCFGKFLRCTRSRVTLEPVCGLNTGGWYFEDFDNICQMELYNCRYRVINWWLQEPVEGVNVRSNRIFFNGWAVNCEEYIYRRRNREEAIKEYLGKDYERIRAMRNEMLRSGVIKEVTTEPMPLDTKEQ